MAEKVGDVEAINALVEEWLDNLSSSESAKVMNKGQDSVLPCNFVELDVHDSIHDTRSHSVHAKCALGHENTVAVDAFRVGASLGSTVRDDLNLTMTSIQLPSSLDRMLPSTLMVATVIPTPSAKPSTPKATAKPRTPIPSGPLTEAEKQYHDAAMELAMDVTGAAYQKQYPSEVERLRGLIATGRGLQPSGRFVSAHPKLLDALDEAEALANAPTNASTPLLKKLSAFIRAMTALLP